jgi:dienelactone hydrolase
MIAGIGVPMNRAHAVLIFGLIWLYAMPGQSGATPRKASFTIANRTVSYEVFKGNDEGPVLILLHGASGPDVGFYRSQAEYLADKGYTVLLLHYFDATGSSTPSTRNYENWVKAVQELIRQCRNDPEWSKRQIALVGYSLGASVALAAGSQDIAVSAIAEWYGSLPDEFFYHFQGMPPLLILHGSKDTNIPVVNALQLIKLCRLKQLTCENHIYDDQGHGFTDKALEDADNRTVDFLSRKLK